MAGISKRLERLEVTAGDGCETCARNPIVIVWGDEEGTGPCPECGAEPVEIEWTSGAANVKGREREG